MKRVVRKVERVGKKTGWASEDTHPVIQFVDRSSAYLQ